MKLRIEVEVGDAPLLDTETGRRELVRILLDAVAEIEDGMPGEEPLVLHDFNHHPVGQVEWLPSEFAVNDRVWDTLTNRRCVVTAVSGDQAGGVKYVAIRDELTSEFRGGYYVYPDGTDSTGMCWISRVSDA